MINDYEDYSAGGMEAAAHQACGFAWNDCRLDSILGSMAALKPSGSTGLVSLDSMLGGGLYPEVYVLAAEPGAGKTTLALQIADYVATFGRRKVLYVSVEMVAAQLVAKSLSRVIAERNIYPPLSVRDVMRMDGCNLDAIEAAVSIYRNETAPNIATIDQRLTVEGIAGIYAALSYETAALPLLVIDYLQIMPSDNESGQTTDYQHHTANMRGLCSIAAQFKVPVLVISSKNRTNRRSKGTDSLAGSSDIEYGAATVMFLAVDGEGEEQEQNQAKANRPVTLTISKNRFGACGSVPLVFLAKESRFIERV